MNGKGFKQGVSRLRRYGITEYGTRNDAQIKLIIYYRSLGYTEKQCYEAMRAWYRAFPHRSRDWESNPKTVLKNLKSAVKSFYRNRRQRDFGSHPENRPQWEWLRKLDTLKINKITGDYRIQKFLFSLLFYIKNHMDANREFRLPSKVIPKFDCCSTETYKAKMRFCEARGLIVKTKECSEMERRARTYRVNFDFTEEGEFVPSLEDGLIRLFPERTLKRKYSRWVFNQYLRNRPKNIKCDFPNRFREVKNSTESNNSKIKSLIHLLLPVPEKKALAPIDKLLPLPDQPLSQTPAVPPAISLIRNNSLPALWRTLPPPTAIIPSLTLNNSLQDSTKSQHPVSTDAGVRRHRRECHFLDIAAFHAYFHPLPIVSKGSHILRPRLPPYPTGTGPPQPRGSPQSSVHRNQRCHPGHQKRKEPPKCLPSSA